MKIDIKLLSISLLLTFLITGGCRGGKISDLDTASGESTSTFLDKEAFTRFENELESIRQKLKIPGFSAAIVQGQELIWSRGFGYANLDKHIEATPYTVYPIASLTKPFAATILMQLEDEGVLALDDPITNNGIDFSSEGVIELQHVLSHTSQDQPGAAFKYNGDRFADLGYLIKNASGKSFRELLNDRIFGPLEMTTTAPNPISMGDSLVDVFGIWLDPNNARIYQRMAQSYQLDSNYNILAGGCPEFFTPAAGLNSTVVDLAKFDIALDKNVLLDQMIKEQMFLPTLSTTGDKLPYGIGWFTQEYDGTRLIWHYGWQPSCSSALILKIPEENITFIILANADNLSRPYRFGSGEVFPIDSTVGLAFYKIFVFEPRYGITVPQIDWEADSRDLAEQLSAITDPKLQKILQRELLSYRKLFHSVGRENQVEKLNGVYDQVYTGSQNILENDAALLEFGGDPWQYLPLPKMGQVAILFIFVLVFLSAVISWPINFLGTRWKRLRVPASDEHKITSKIGQNARVLAFVVFLLNMAIPILYIGYISSFPSFSGEVFMHWTAGSSLAKALIAIANFSLLAGLALAWITVQVWSNQDWNTGWRVHYTLVLIVQIAVAIVWGQLGMLGWI